MEALAERIASLPKSFPVKSLYDQLEKLDAKKKEHEAQLQSLKQSGSTDWDGEAVDLSSFEKFAKMATEVIANADIETKKTILKTLVGKIEIAPDKVKIGFYADKEYFQRLLKDGFKRSEEIKETSDVDLSLSAKCDKILKKENRHSENYLLVAARRGGSHSLTIGARRGT